jgi:hypothetical protein
VVQQYAGAPRAAETIAIIRVDGSGRVQLLSLDGEATDARVTSDARLHIEILPGYHTVWVQGLTDAAQPLTFRAEAGKVYRVEFVSDATTLALSPRVYEVDRSSNTLKADVTVRAAPSTEAEPQQRPRTAPPKAPVIVEQSSASPAPADAGSPPADAGAPADRSVPAP